MGRRSCTGFGRQEASSTWKWRPEYRRAVFGEQAPHDLGGLVEHVEPRADVGERIAVGGRLPDVPASADAELEASAGDVVECRGGLGEQGGVAIPDVEHQAPDARVVRLGRQCPQRRHGLEVRLRTAARRGLVEVIPCGNPVDADGIELAPQGPHLGHGQVLLSDVNAERNGHRVSLLLDGIGQLAESGPERVQDRPHDASFDAGIRVHHLTCRGLVVGVEHHDTEGSFVFSGGPSYEPHHALFVQPFKVGEVVRHRGLLLSGATVFEHVRPGRPEPVQELRHGGPLESARGAYQVSSPGSVTRGRGSGTAFRGAPGHTASTGDEGEVHMPVEPVDVLIVGAGASGAAAAWSLAETRMRIVCLEQGDWMNPAEYPSTGRDWEARAFGDFSISPNRRGRVTDYPVNDDDSPISVANFNAVGGSTILYAGHFPRFHPSDFRVRTLDGVADDWPIDFDTLAPFYAENDRMMGVSGQRKETLHKLLMNELTKFVDEYISTDVEIHN